jgi:hypothetical protein
VYTKILELTADLRALTALPRTVRANHEVPGRQTEAICGGAWAWARAVKLNLKWQYALWKASRPSRPVDLPCAFRPVFVIGCGRSGTSILGTCIALHPRVRYLFEPWHLWAAADPLNDAANLFRRHEARLLRDADECDEMVRRRFARLFAPGRRAAAKLTVEKTPINALRIGYINSLAPDARFVHIARDGGDVCRSIDRLATENRYRIAGKSNWNVWWGVDHHKWTVLVRDGKRAGYYPDQVDQLTSHGAKGAYEWLVSLGEVDRWRTILGDRLHEINYEQLAENPVQTFRQLSTFLEIDPHRRWLGRSSRMIGRTAKGAKPPVHLPDEMCEAFNQYQERFGFASRAAPVQSPYRQRPPVVEPG